LAAKRHRRRKEPKWPTVGTVALSRQAVIRKVREANSRIAEFDGVRLYQQPPDDPAERLESGGAPPQSKTLAHGQGSRGIRQVLDCACALALSIPANLPAPQVERPRQPVPWGSPGPMETEGWLESDSSLLASCQECEERQSYP
jgi:hypothetical protein